MNKQIILLVAAAVISCSPILAEEQIRRIQEELRKRNMYFGEIDGQKTEETIRALRNYQKRKGFNPTGEPDGDTLGSLNLVQPVGGTQAWPDVPVLKSDTKREIQEKDREYLESLDPIAEGPEFEEGPTTQQPPSPKLVTPPKVGTPQTTERPPRAETPPKPETSRTPDKDARPPKREPAPTKEAASSLPPDRAEEFVRSYLDACETNQLASETAYYADKVKYFDHGLVDRRFIERDVAAFYKRWPERSYELLDFKVLHAGEDQAVVKFRISFDYKSPQHKVRGKTDNVFTIQKSGDRLKFTSLRERRLRE